MKPEKILYVANSVAYVMPLMEMDLAVAIANEILNLE